MCPMIRSETGAVPLYSAPGHARLHQSGYKNRSRKIRLWRNDMKSIQLAGKKTDAGFILTVSAVLALSVFTILSAAQELPFIAGSGVSDPELESAAVSDAVQTPGLCMDLAGTSLRVRDQSGETILNCEFPDEGDLINLSFGFRLNNGTPVQDIGELTGSWALVFNSSKSQASLCRVRLAGDDSTLIFSDTADIDYDPAHTDCRIQNGTFYYIDPEGTFSRLDLTSIHARQEPILTDASRLYMEDGSGYAYVDRESGLYRVDLEDPWDYQIVG